MNNRENYLRAVQFGYPEWIPYAVHISSNTWITVGAELEKVVLRHPRTWPGYKPRTDWTNISVQAHQNPDIEFVDRWGNEWRTVARGMTGTVVKPALHDLTKLASYTPPDPQTYNGCFYPIDWAKTKQHLDNARQAGRLAAGGLAHGFHMLLLEYLRGFDNLMCDLIDDTPEFRQLVSIVHELNKKAVSNWIDAGAEIIRLPEDLGGQTGSFVGPQLFAKWVAPYHRELHDLVHSHGILTDFHCDGNIMDVADQILAIGPDVFNPQDVANGIDALGEVFKGRVCIDLDFDRQNALCFGSPQDIWDLLEYEVKHLGQPKGGLMINVGVWGEVPPENVEAVASGLEKLCGYWNK